MRGVWRRAPPSALTEYQYLVVLVAICFTNLFKKCRVILIWNIACPNFHWTENPSGATLMLREQVTKAQKFDHNN